MDLGRIKEQRPAFQMKLNNLASLFKNRVEAPKR